MYICIVVAGVLCPISIAMVATSTPRSFSLVAKVCRRSCGDRRGMSMAAQTFSIVMVKADASIMFPVLVANTYSGAAVWSGLQIDC